MGIFQSYEYPPHDLLNEKEKEKEKKELFQVKYSYGQR